MHYTAEVDEFLSEQIKKSVFRVSLNPSRGHQEETLFKSRGPFFAFARVGADQLWVLSDLMSHGYKIVETSLQFALNPSEFVVKGNRAGDSIRVIRASAEEVDDVGALAQNAFTHSRFHGDAKIGVATANAIKRDWAKNLALGHRGVCYVARDSRDPTAKLNGFIGVVSGKDRETELPYQSIDLIAVDPLSQGRGVGRALIESVLENVSTSCVDFRAGTQSKNLAAIALYLSIGMRLKSVDFALHLHG